MRLAANLTETAVVNMWQRLALNTDLTTETGQPLRVIYAGRVNDEHGADFRDAVVTIGRIMNKGDIEIHVRSRDWHTHGHHLDPFYNRVILQVVWRHDRTPVTLQNGRSVPTLALDRYLPAASYLGGSQLGPPATPNTPCCQTGHHLSDHCAAELLDTAGEQRFAARVRRFQTELAYTAGSQVLYQAIMTALGYSRNKAPFLELAQRVPLADLELLARGHDREEYLAQQQARLLGTAGLLPPPRQAEAVRYTNKQWLNKLEKLWNVPQPAAVMPDSAWQLFKVRPGNSPVRRMAAMSHLLLRYRQGGLLLAMIDLVRETNPGNQGYRRLREALVVAADGHWSGSQTLLGSERATDIVVNVLLPFVAAWSGIIDQPELERKALALYEHHPKLATNSVARHMASQLGLGRRLINSARRQQGLLHLYYTRCTQGRCHVCPLGRTPKPA
ncbi:MAG: DUF2851 family protein [Dehalococcoidales bacterium]|nr:DUF2851 family protein [Dehalococcoidales bacterium]